MPLPKPYYEDDSVTIYHGDCREILPLLEIESIDLVLTDPPYDITSRKLKGIWKAVAPTMKPQAPLIWTFNTCRLAVIGQTLIPEFTEIRSAVWEKPYCPSPWSFGWSWHWEPILWWMRGKERKGISKWKFSQPDIVRVNTIMPSDDQRTGHHDQKPIALWRQLAPVVSHPWAEIEDWPPDPDHPEEADAAPAEIERGAEPLAEALLELDVEHDWATLRQLIMLAEDTGFTGEQSEKLAPRLLELALQRRDSNDPHDEAPVWAAIRTGASMLRPDQAASLLPLLEPGHAVETSLVAIKMLGRIFEAQPPADVDLYPEMAAKAKEVADSLLNPYGIAVSQGAALAQVAIYALAAVASTETIEAASAVRQLGIPWFTRRAVRKLRSLQEYWQGPDSAAAAGPRDVLNRALEELSR